MYDGDGDELHLNYIKNAVGGIIVEENGLLRFTANPGFTGLASFEYQAADSTQATVDGRLEFVVQPADHPVTIGEDIFLTAEEQIFITSINALLANDTDPKGGTVSWGNLGSARHGTVAKGPDGAITFTPDVNYSGSDAGFSYTAHNEAGQETAGFVKVNVSNVNDAPQVTATNLILAEDQNLIFNDKQIAAFTNDVDGDKLTLTSFDLVSHGSIQTLQGTPVFIPEANYHGPASLQYTVSDGLMSTTGALTITITSVDDSTTSGPDTLTTNEETAVTVSAARLLANDSDPDGNLLFAGTGHAVHGSVSTDMTGTITFTPETDYFGDKAGFTYTVGDADGYMTDIFVPVSVANINDTPTPAATSLFIKEDQPFVFDQKGIGSFVHDADYDLLNLSSLSIVSGIGTISLSDGRYIYTPPANSTGQALLAYTVTDSHDENCSALLNLTVDETDDPTVFGPDSFSIMEEQQLALSARQLLANDNDPDGTLTFAGVSGAKHGSVTADAAGNILFTAAEDYSGTEAGFSYHVIDAHGFLSENLVTIKVTNVNDVPHNIYDQLYISEDQTWAMDQATLAGFIKDADGDPLHITSISNVAGGIFTETQGIYTFIPDQNYYGQAAFDYTVTDGNSPAISGHMDITISPVNDLPSVAPLTAGMAEDGELTFTVSELLASAQEVEDGKDLRFGGITGSISGDAYLDMNNLVHFLPNDDFAGQAFFRYSVIDPEGGMSYGNVAITVNGINDAPVAINDYKILAWSNNSYENIYSASVLLDNDTDMDGDSLTITGLGQAKYGRVNLDQLGNIHYTAATNDWIGIDSFTYRITDGQGEYADATAFIDVKTNTSPNVYPEILTIEEDVITNLPQSVLLANDGDINGEHLYITSVGNAQHCSVQMLADGSILWVPELNINSSYPETVSFAYSVSDGISEPVTTHAYFDILPVNDAPILSPERLGGAVEDNAFAFTPAQLMANDTDVEMVSPYEEDSLAFAGVFGAAHGTISYNAASDTIFYTPLPNFNGLETFNYTLVDSQGAHSTVTSQIAVAAVNDRPIVEEDIGSPAEEVIWNYYKISNLLANDFDADGDHLTISNPYMIDGHASVKIDGNNLCVKPADGENRLEIGYTVNDGHGSSELSKLTINTILEHNYAPTFSGIYTANYHSYNRHGTSESGILDFSFHAEDKNGGNSWGEDMGDIMDVALSPGFATGYESYSFKEYDGDNFALHFSRDIHSSLTFTITATDYSGATGSIYVQVNDMLTDGGVHTYHYPIILDRDGDGVELLGVSAGTAFDWNRDGVPEVTGWAGKDDAFFVYDVNGNGLVDTAQEIALREYVAGAATDLDGLRFFDSNHDNVFNNLDDQWASFGLWQDKNSDGLTDAGEFLNVAQSDVASINLTGTPAGTTINDNIVYNTITYTMKDGSQGSGVDVALQGQELQLLQVTTTSPTTTENHLTDWLQQHFSTCLVEGDQASATANLNPEKAEHTESSLSSHTSTTDTLNQTPTAIAETAVIAPIVNPTLTSTTTTLANPAPAVSAGNATTPVSAISSAPAETGLTTLGAVTDSAHTNSLTGSSALTTDAATHNTSSAAAPATASTTVSLASITTTVSTASPAGSSTLTDSTDHALPAATAAPPTASSPSILASQILSDAATSTAPVATDHPAVHETAVSPSLINIAVTDAMHQHLETTCTDHLLHT